MAGRLIRSAQDFLNAEGQAPIGESVRIGFLREGRTSTASLLIQPTPELDGEVLGRRFEGALFTELPTRLRNGRNAGVLIAELAPRSRLAYEGLRPGDIITGANRQRIRNLRDMRDILEGERGSILLQIRRDGEAYIARIE